MFGFDLGSDMRESLARERTQSKGKRKSAKKSITGVAMLSNERKSIGNVLKGSQQQHTDALDSLESNVNPFHLTGSGGGGGEDDDPGRFLESIGLGETWGRFQQLGIFSMDDLKDPAICSDATVSFQYHKHLG